MADKRYDATDVVEALERHGLVPIIPARTGKLMPRGGSRLRAWMNYEAFRELVGNVRSLSIIRLGKQGFVTPLSRS